ncbi:MAG: hypothetical protein OEZ22_03700 [Spirochaetia bacterium]|nr:hypothetical protein [Spirochaetia bacterium]
MKINIKKKHIISISFFILFIVFILLICDYCAYYLIQNYLYLILSIFVFSFASYFLKDNVWEKESPPFIWWITYFLILGFYFSYFLEPNFFRFFHILIIKRNYKLEYFLNFLSSIAAWSGWIIFFFYLCNLFFEKKLINRKYSLQSFFLWIYVYLVYLNITVSVIHRLLLRPF